MGVQWAGEKVVDVKLLPPWSWVSYVGAVTSVLRSRGIECDFTEVAGMSGYAFIINIHPELFPVGPVAFDWEVLVEGTQALGLTVEMIAVERGEDEQELLVELFERVRAEVDAGRCCVVWGAGAGPEFGIVYGYREDCYLVRSSRSCGRREGEIIPLGPEEKQEEPVRFDRLQTTGRLAALFFTTPIKPDRERQERQAVSRAVKLLRGQQACFDPDYYYGASAFRTWADVLEKGKADFLGNAYSVMCYWELQMFAAGFCQRLAKRWSKAAEQLNQAAELFHHSFGNLDCLKKTLPGAAGVDLKKWAASSKISHLFQECAADNEKAAAALERALALM